MVNPGRRNFDELFILDDDILHRVRIFVQLERAKRTSTSLSAWTSFSVTNIQLPKSFYLQAYFQKRILYLVDCVYCMVRFIDGQVRLVRLQMDNFRLILCQQTDKQQTSVCTMSKRQTVNGLRKIAWTSVFCLKWQHIYICVLQFRYIHSKLFSLFFCSL